jgi:uncharacterized membrane protein
MNKIDFLNELYHYIRVLPRDKQNKIMNEYREYFKKGEKSGKTENQICMELGSPYNCARHFLGDTPPEKVKPMKNNKSFWTVAFFWNVFQAFFAIPITLGIFIAVVIMIVAYSFIVPAIGSVAFLVFAVASTSTVFCLGVITLLWTIFQIKECVDRMNKGE